MLKNLQSTKTLHNGIEIPYVGLGVYQMKDPSETVQAVRTAIQSGYRSIDTAAIYDNEESVGQGVKEGGVAREDLFITSKVWNSDQGYDTTLKAFETSLKKLDMDYLDMYLIHWPVEGKYNDTWKAMERLHGEGLIKSIGVSNFHQHHLEDLMKNGNEKPVLNQIELHPRLNQEKIREFCASHNVAVEAWSPIAQGRVLDEPTLNHIAEKHEKSAAQVILRWHLQNDVIIIPKSVHENRIKENADLFNFELSLEEMNQINQLNLDERFGPDPDNFDF
ncbi:MULTISPECIES: aldo/keto reductase [unclassified Rossellomorea]|uniref:aldo/keto reductase n=1 Tax=unclassified Rossellomorea TaxID=2837526 RepID=UPI0020C5F8BC|nr:MULTISPECIES: aldo/keto reductase [unclassified Rossellomorea]UTE78950.1 aldo/keto reductase [Rossellomorea sp. KS-H15a]WGG47009.1 aldo/keto reductase [Rossellomorea sp. DA94]